MNVRLYHKRKALEVSDRSIVGAAFRFGERLFEPDKRSPFETEDALRRVRHRIYSFVWCRDREDVDRGDFIMTSWGVRRNLNHDYPRSRIHVHHDLTLLHHDTSLLFTNAATSEDFSDYIYGVSKVEIPINVTYQTDRDYQRGRWRIHLDEDMLVANLSMNKRLFEAYATDVDVVIIFPTSMGERDFYDAGVNLGAIRDTLDQWDLGAKDGQLRIIVNYPTNHVTYLELQTAVFSFLPMAFTG
ncbi:hypothetical protein NM208_g14641 [Fusarium decemcellulare]|uniref:Uncharacterized protein n=1 Tax=Fusarium decemcellulare TaxID=57161 RepID=A0ACC1RHV3_9HYPO|nr:hypothetical protein NM208_g14641 [Fusarium decemcellulare]